jgi:1,2-diacylglycerol 3-beta-galactosyltransferase
MAKFLPNPHKADQTGHSSGNSLQKKQRSYGLGLERPLILFLFSDTGGGHRSAAEAIIEGLRLEIGDRVETRMVDIFKDYAPAPLNLMPELYPKMVRMPQAWGLGYRLSNGPGQVRFLTASAWPYVRRAVRKLIVQNPSDLIVSVHPLATASVLRALGPNRPPFVTVVTDLVSTHAFWYNRNTDLCIVPTEAARQRALFFGLRDKQVKVIGLPVAERFCQPPGDRHALRMRLGWPLDRPVVLLVGGGEGMGPLERSALAIASSCPTAALVVITGRNESLRERLENYQWPIPTFIYGFVHQMPDFMRAAEILVTKAGPGTITEALNAELPMILYSRLPGQEDGNVGYVEAEGAGVWAPQPEMMVAALQSWIKYPKEREKVVAACRRLACPDAARKIACILAEQVGLAANR